MKERVVCIKNYGNDTPFCEDIRGYIEKETEEAVTVGYDLSKEDTDYFETMTRKQFEERFKRLEE